MAMSLAISAVTAAKAHDDGRRNANTQSDALKEAAYLEGNDLQRQQSQEASAAADQMNEHAQAASADMAHAQTIAGEYGGGNTIERGLAVLGAQQSGDLATVAANAGKVGEQTRFDALASNRRAASRLASIQRPSAFGTALTIGAAAVNSYATAKSLEKPKLDSPYALGSARLGEARGARLGGG